MIVMRKGTRFFSKTIYCVIIAKNTKGVYMIQSINIFNNGMYWVHFDGTNGSEQSGDRPALVIRTTKESPICTVLPITKERYHDNYPYHVDLNWCGSAVLIEQIRTIDKSRIYGVFMNNRTYAQLSSDERDEINKQLGHLYHLKELKSSNTP
jgi:mRNA-degrading endonuclease toxin of MazEF toxin-antitoxin module